MNKKRPNLKNLFETLVNDNITTLKMVLTIVSLHLARVSNLFESNTVGGALYQSKSQSENELWNIILNFYEPGKDVKNGNAKVFKQPGLLDKNSIRNRPFLLELNITKKGF